MLHIYIHIKDHKGVSLITTIKQPLAVDHPQDGAPASSSWQTRVH